MDEIPLPPNVEPHKLKKPKGWSYPLKTSEFVDGLNLGKVNTKVKIFYDNSPERPYKASKKDAPNASFTVFSMTFYGHLAKHPNEEEPYFFIAVRVCKPEYRQRLLKVIQEEVFPVVKRWMVGIQAKPTVNSISLRYYDRPYMADHKPDEAHQLILTENKDRQMFVKSINLDKQEDDDAAAAEEAD